MKEGQADGRKKKEFRADKIMTRGRMEGFRYKVSNAFQYEKENNNTFIYVESLTITKPFTTRSFEAFLLHDSSKRAWTPQVAACG